jgi:hypothetical protein
MEDWVKENLSTRKEKTKHTPRSKKQKRHTLPLQHNNRLEQRNQKKKKDLKIHRTHNQNGRG